MNIKNIARTTGRVRSLFFVSFVTFCSSLPAQQNTNNPGVPLFGSPGVSSGLQFVFVNGLGNIASPANFDLQNAPGILNSASATNAFGVRAAFLTDVQPVGTNVWIVNQATGNDAIGLPYAHISNAVQAATARFASSGLRQTVVVYPGTYNEHNLLAPGVDYLGLPGASIKYIETTTNENGWGIFDDRACGPTSNNIVWPSAISYMGVTNADMIFGTNANSTQINANSLGALIITNQNTFISAHIGKLEAGWFFDALQPTCLYVADDNGSILTVDQMDDPFAFQTVTHIFHTTQWHTNIDANVPNQGIYWGLGDLTVNCPRIISGQYSIWANEPTGGPFTNNLYFQGEYLNGKIYTVATDPTYKGWFSFNQLECTNAGSISCIDVNGGGKWYVTAQKLNMVPANNNLYCVETYIGVANTADVWLNVEKYAAPQWFNITEGTVHNVLASHFSDETGIVTNGLNINGANAVVYINGGEAEAAGQVIGFAAGKAYLKGMRLQTTNQATVGVGGSGLSLADCILISPVSNTISASSGQTVAVYNCTANTNWNSNITLSPSNNFFVNASVK